MHPELENLIKIALADGVITEKEKSIILRKAEVLGEDRDEVEMIIEGKIAELSRVSSEKQSSSAKEGGLKKCPSCGSPVKAFKISCEFCGHEFRESKALTSKQKLHEELVNAEKEERSRSLSWSEKLDAENVYQRNVDSRKASIVSSFPLPNNKEDILEFFNWSIQESIKTGGVQDQGTLRKAWKSKALELKTKIALELKDDSHAQILIKEFDKTKGKIFVPKQLQVFIGLLLFAGLLIGGILLGGTFHDEEVAKEKERLESILSSIYQDIDSKNYEAALIKSSSLKWEYEDSWSKKDTDKLSTAWDEKRIELIKSIKEAQNKN